MRRMWDDGDDASHAECPVCGGRMHEDFEYVGDWRRACWVCERCYCVIYKGY